MDKVDAEKLAEWLVGSIGAEQLVDGYVVALDGDTLEDIIECFTTIITEFKESEGNEDE